MNAMKRILIVLTVYFILFSACSGKKGINSGKVYYVNYICKNDTLLSLLKAGTSGKAAYYDLDKNLQIVSINYLTEPHPNTHFFKITDEIIGKPELKSIKYEIIFNESMINDSIAYSLKKYYYSEEGWKAKSDMGIIKVFNFPSERDKVLRVYKKNVAINVIRTIVKDTYEE